MAVTFVGSGALAVNATVTTQSISSHANTAVDDILIAQIANRGGASVVISPPDGTWTEIIQGHFNSGFDHALYWKRATAAGVQAFTFSKAVDDNVVFGGVISSWRGCPTAGSPLDATAATQSHNATSDNVTFTAFDPTNTDSHVIFMAYYGNDTTTFAAAMSSDTNPDCTIRYDEETATGSDISLACTSGDTTDGANIASRTWASASGADFYNVGVVFALAAATVTPKSDPPFYRHPMRNHLVR